MEKGLIRQIFERAGNVCEYCLIPRAHYPAPFQIDHVISRQHSGLTAFSNLALSCLHCNSHKGPNIAGLDSKTGKLTPLFNPRRHKWAWHFRWKAPFLIGQTSIGRVTVAVLNINGVFLVQLREALLLEGIFPPVLKTGKE